MATPKIVSHSYRSPLLGAHDYHNRHPTQLDTITKTSYESKPIQRELAARIESTAVADTIKLEGSNNDRNTVSQCAYSAPSDKAPSTLFYGEGSTRVPPVVKTPKELARDYRYLSNVFVEPGPNSGADNYSTNRLGFMPPPDECFKREQIRYPSMQMSCLGQGRFAFNVKTEYAKSYDGQQPDAENRALKKRDSKALYCPIGPAKLNVTHNIITGMYEKTALGDANVAGYSFFRR